MRSLPALYVGALLSARRRAERGRRFEPIHRHFPGLLHEPERHAAYCAVVGYDDPQRVRPSWLYVLAQRPLMATLLDERFPFPMVGMVHLANHSELVTPPQAKRPIDAQVTVTLRRTTSAGHVLGVETELRQGAATLGRNHAEALVRCPEANRPPRAPPEALAPPEDARALPYDGAAGRRYARVSEDWNPIHLHPLLARPFGFRRPIAHGMYSAARIAALLERDGIAASRRLEVTYRQPVALPSTAHVAWRAAERGAAFSLHGADRLLLEGRVA